MTERPRTTARRATSQKRALTVAAGELPERWGDVAGSLKRVDALLDRAKGVDLVLLPEAALTGYISPQGVCDLEPFAEPLEGPTTERLSALAKHHGIALAGPLIERDGARVFNALVLFDREGRRLGHWRKRHPWYPETWATPGDLGTPVVSFEGLRITAGICFDAHFLSDDAGPSLDEADVLLFPSAWVDTPEGGDAREGILTGLAARHGVWVVNANWGWSRPAFLGQGGSRIVDPGGNVVARAEDARGAHVVVAEVPSGARGRRG